MHVLSLGFELDGATLKLFDEVQKLLLYRGFHSSVNYREPRNSFVIKNISEIYCDERDAGKVGYI